MRPGLCGARFGPSCSARRSPAEASPIASPIAFARAACARTQPRVWASRAWSATTRPWAGGARGPPQNAGNRQKRTRAQAPIWAQVQRGFLNKESEPRRACAVRSRPLAGEPRRACAVGLTARHGPQAPVPTEEPEAAPAPACSVSLRGRAEGAVAVHRDSPVYSCTSEFEVLTFPCICITGRFLKVFRKLYSGCRSHKADPALLTQHVADSAGAAANTPLPRPES